MIKKYNNRILALAVTPVIATLLLACGTNTATSLNDEDAKGQVEASSEASEASEVLGTEEFDTEETANSSSEYESGDSDNDEYEDIEWVEKFEYDGKSEMTEVMFTRWAVCYENYGFLMSEYDSPENCDYKEVFYAMDSIAADLSQSEYDAVYNYYVKNISEDGPQTDMTCIRTSVMDEFLMRKVGIKTSDIPDEKKFGSYVEEIDAYFTVHGDTNIMGYRCESFTKDGDTYIVNYSVGSSSLYKDCTITLKWNGEEFQPVSNKFR